MSRNGDLVAALIKDFSDITAEVLERTLHLPAEQAAELGLQVAVAVCREHAGLTVYIPQGVLQQLDERDQALYTQYQRNGRNAAALAQEHGLSVQTVYRRLRLVEAQERARRQGSLFPAAR